MPTTKERDDARREALREVLREALEVHIEADTLETPPELEARVREHVLRLAASGPVMGPGATIAVGAVAATAFLLQNAGGATALYLATVAFGAMGYGALVRRLVRRSA